MSLAPPQRRAAPAFRPATSQPASRELRREQPRTPIAPRVPYRPQYLRKVTEPESEQREPAATSTLEEETLDDQTLDEEALDESGDAGSAAGDAMTDAGEALGPGKEGAAKDGKAAGKSGRKARGKTLERAAVEPAPKVEPVPQPETGPVMLEQQPVRPGSAGRSFETPAAPAARAPPRAGARAEPPPVEQERALQVFREALATVRRLHDDLVADAMAAGEGARSTAAQLAARRQADLDRGLDALSTGLRGSRGEFDRAADGAESFVDQREAQTRGAIRRVSATALGALNAAKAKADTEFGKHKDSKEKVKKKADGEADSVKAAGTSASAAIEGLNARKEQLWSTSVDPMGSAVHEAIGVRLPTRAPARAKTYVEESTAEHASLTATFSAMKTAIDEQFGRIVGEMSKTASSSNASITRARDSALKQLGEQARQVRGSIAETRARGHATLVRQHDQSRRQLVGAYRGRARSEDQAAQQRATRGSAAAQALAGGQQAGARSLAESLEKETARPPAEFAKVMSSSASALMRNVQKTGAGQRARVLHSTEAGEAGAVRQASATGARLATTGSEMVERLAASARGTSEALEKQVAAAVEPFDQLPEPVTAAFNGALPSARAAYESHNALAKTKVQEAEGTITGAMKGEGGGTGKATGTAAPPAPAAAEGAAGTQPKEIPEQFRDRSQKIAAKAETDEGIADLVAAAKKVVPDTIREKASTINGALVAFSTPVEQVLGALRTITGLQGAALSFFYSVRYQRNLEAHIRAELWKTFSADSTNEYNISAAINYLRGNRVAAALADMKAAVNYSNDEGRVERIQRSLTPAELDQLNSQHAGDVQDVLGDLDGTDEKVSKALNKVKPVDPKATKEQAKEREEANLAALGEANAYGLQQDIDRARAKHGEDAADATTDAIVKRREMTGMDVLSGGDALGPALEDPDAVRARREKLWKATDTAFEKKIETLPDGSPYQAPPGEKGGPGAIARYAAAARTYQKFVPDDGPNGGHYEMVKEGLDARQTQLIEAIVKKGPDSEEAAAATIAVELNRKSGKPKEDRLRKALGSDPLAAREGESNADREKRLNDKVDKDGKIIRKGDRRLAQERREKILQLYGDLAASGQESGEAKAPPKSTEEVKTGILSTLDQQLSGDPTARAYTRSMVENLEPDPVAAFDFALAHEDKNKETLQATTGRMNRDQIDEAVAKWDAKYPNGPRLYQRLGMFEHGSGALEGDARNETEISFMGVPRNDRERAEVANMYSKQQARDSGFAGRAMAGEEYARLLENQDRLLKMMGVSRGDIDQYGRIKKTGPDGQPIVGNFDEEGKLKVDAGDRDEFEAAMQMSRLNAEEYKQAVDRVAMGVTMALMVIAAAVTTFVTFGGAAAIWGPILVTAAAGMVGIGMSAAIKGDRYTSAEMQRDLVMTFVQAATAGLGAYAGAAMRGAAPAAKAAANSQKVVGQVAGTAAKQGLTRGAKALQFGKEVVIDAAVGGTSNAINSAAGAAMDPEHRRKGKSADKALDAGIKSFLGGAVGSALTKPFGALPKRTGPGGTPTASLGERVGSNVVGGFATRVTEARVGQALGEQHQSWSESLESAKEGIAQDAVQGFAERGADRLGGRRAATRARTGSHAVDGAPTHAHHDADEPAAPVRPLTDAADDRAPSSRPQAREPDRAAAVHAALPPEVRAVVDTALPPKAAPGEPALPRPPGDASPALKPVADDAHAPAVPLDGAPSRMPGTAPAEAPRASATRPAADPAAPALKPGLPKSDDPAAPKRKPAKPPPPPAAARKAAASAEVVVIDLLDPGTGIMTGNPRDHSEIAEVYRTLIKEQPHLEVGIYRNKETGEYVCFQGAEEEVHTGYNKTGETEGLHPAGYAQRWKELLDADVGHWELQEHYHPLGSGETETAAPWRRLPSAEDGDLHVMQAESDMGGGQARESRLHYMENGVLNHTDFGFDPGSPKGPYWVDVSAPAGGGRERHHFKNLEEYRGFFKERTGVEMAPPELAPSSTPKASMAKRDTSGDEPVAAPLPDELVLFHGTSGRIEGDISVQRGGNIQDFGTAFYLTPQRSNAQEYAGKRGDQHNTQGTVYEFRVSREALGVVVDVRPGGKHRAAFEEHLNKPSMYAGLGPEYLERTGLPATRAKEVERIPGIERRGPYFDEFLAKIGMLHADVVIGDLGGLGTGGVHAPGGGEQIAIRSQKIADQLTQQLPGRAGGAPGGVPAAGAAPPVIKPQVARVKPPSAPAAVVEQSPSAGNRAPPSGESTAPSQKPHERPVPADIEAAFEQWGQLDKEMLPRQGIVEQQGPRPDGQVINRPSAADREAVEAYAKQAPRQGALLKQLLATDEATVGKLLRLADAPKKQAEAIAELRQLLGGRMPAAQADAQIAALTATLRDPAMLGALSSARERAAWSEFLEALDPRHRALAQDSSRLRAVARMDPELAAERYQSMREKFGRRKFSTADFEKKWDAFQRAMHLPVASEADAVRTLAKRLGLQVLKADAARGGTSNQGGIDIIGFIRPDPSKPPPDHVEVRLIDDKAENTKSGMLNKVSAQTENLGKNLRSHADEIAKALEDQRAKGVPIDPYHEMAVKQLLKAAAEIEALDRGRIGRGGSRARHKQPRYIDEVVRILEENHIVMQVTSERGNVSRLAQLLQLYRFRLKFEDEDAADRAAAAPSVPAQ